MSEDECDHKFEQRSIWKSVIPIPELMTMISPGNGTLHSAAGDIIRAAIYHVYSHDICVHCGKMVYPHNETTQTQTIRAVKLPA